MKKCIAFLLLLLASCPFIIIFAQKGEVAYADNETDIDETIDELLDKTDLDSFQSMIDSLGFSEDYSVKQLFDDLLHNEFPLDFSYLCEYLSKCFFGNIKGLLAEMILILIVVVLLSILQNVTSGFNNTSTKKIVYIASYGTITTILGIAVTSLSKSVITMINGITTFSDTVFPLLLTFVTAIGSTTSAAIYQPLVVVFSQVIVKLVQTVIMPLFYISFVFAIVGNMSDEIKLERFSEVAKSAGNWITGIIFGLFITYMTSRGITGVGIDSLAVRGTKYALGNYVPVIGSYLKDGFDLITTGCIVIKNGLGFVALLLFLLFILDPIVKILSTSLVLKLTAALCEPFGEKKISQVLTSVSKSMTIPLIACVALSFTMIIMLSLIILTYNGGIL